MIPQNLFDATHYSMVRKPLLEASTLPPWCYTSAEFYQREIERIFLRCWQFVGREDEILNAGDYLTYDGVGGPVVVIRGDDGAIRGLYNSCRHRGTRMLNGKGCAANVVCPYHSWVYANDGRLKRAPGMSTAAGFRLEDQGLLPVRCESWAGFMFICYTGEGPSLSEFLGNMPSFFDAYQPEQLVCVRRVQYQIDANWKLVIENALEAYHTGTVHAATLGRQESAPVETRGNWDAEFVYVGNADSIAVLPGTAPPLPRIEGLTGDQCRGTYFTDIYPCTQFAFAQDCMWWLAVQPDGPDRCEMVLGSCFPATTTAAENFEYAVQAYYRRWDEATPEDNAIAESQQHGQRVLRRPPGRFAEEEISLHRLANWVLDRVVD